MSDGSRIGSAGNGQTADHSIATRRAQELSRLIGCLETDEFSAEIGQ